MTRRLFWLFLLICGVLLLLSLMVAAEEPARVPCAAPMTIRQPAALRPAAAEPPAAPREDALSGRLSFLPRCPRAPAQPALRRGVPYREYAYYAFHDSDRAG